MPDRDARRDGHVPVLLERVVELLAPALGGPGAVVVDATLGLGGHSEALLRRFGDLHLVGLDRDLQGAQPGRGGPPPPPPRAPPGGAPRPTPRAPRWCTPSTTRSATSSPAPATLACRACCSTSGCRRCSSTR